MRRELSGPPVFDEPGIDSEPDVRGGHDCDHVGQCEECGICHERRLRCVECGELKADPYEFFDGLRCRTCCDAENVRLSK